MPNTDAGKLDREMSAGIQYRQFELRSIDAETGVVEGIAVPWGQRADLGWFTEEFERGAVEDSDDAQLWYRHMDPIGLLLEARDEDAGWWIRAKISSTSLGEDVKTLARDGVVKHFSVGFESREYAIREDANEDGRPHVVQRRVRVRETSLVPLPAYEGAQVQNVRQGGFKSRGIQTMPETNPAAGTETAVIDPQEFAHVREGLSELERRFAGFEPIIHREEDVVDKRSAGEILKAIAVDRDETTIEFYNMMQRAFASGDGGVLADTVVKAGWVGDLTRLISQAAPLLDFFSRGTLPDTGMSIEYAQLKSNTVKVEKQAAEGDNLAYGKVQIETKTAPVGTYGGWSELSRQVIERSTVGVLNTTLDAQAIAVGKAMNAAFRAVFLAAIAAQTTAGNTVSVPAAGADYHDWIDAIVDSAVKFDALGLPMDGLLVNPVLFKALGRIEASDGRPILLTSNSGGTGVNNVGTLNPVALRGNLAGLEITMDAGWTGSAPAGAFANARSIRSYVSPFVRLQDENIVNLSKQFSVYNYAAFANEIPAALVPVEFAAAG
jgi:HK97 family phage prohead protease/HK97 family phage major capsid protein